MPSSAQPSQAATGGSQISWAEISFIITAQPPTHPGIVVEKDKKEKEKKIFVNKIKKIFTFLKQNKTEKKKWLEFKSQKSECLDFILKKKIQKKKMKKMKISVNDFILKKKSKEKDKKEKKIKENIC